MKKYRVLFIEIDDKDILADGYEHINLRPFSKMVGSFLLRDSVILKEFLDRIKVKLL